jgi:hypothetical protein
MLDVGMSALRDAHLAPAEIDTTIYLDLLADGRQAIDRPLVLLGMRRTAQ